MCFDLKFFEPINFDSGIKLMPQVIKLRQLTLGLKLRVQLASSQSHRL